MPRFHQKRYYRKNKYRYAEEQRKIINSERSVQKINQEVKNVLDCVLNTVCPAVDRHFRMVDCDVANAVNSFIDQTCLNVDTKIVNGPVYSPFMPDFVLDWAHVRSTIKCPSCPKKFPCYIDLKHDSRTMHSSYYRHCATICSNHRRELLFCSNCRSVFVEKEIQQMHIKYCLMTKEVNDEQAPPHRVVNIMKDDEEINITAMLSARAPDFPEIVECPGCYKEFAAAIDDYGLLIYEPAYENHCLECAEYLSCGFVRECDDCNKKFLNLQLYAEHNRTIHMGIQMKTFAMSIEEYKKEYRKLEEMEQLNEERKEANRKQFQMDFIREEMKLARQKAAKRAAETSTLKSTSETVTKSSLRVEDRIFRICYPPIMEVYNLTKKCPGCNALYPAAADADGVVIPHRAFYTHCIRNCKEYPHLFRVPACCLCQLIFLNEVEGMAHQEEVHQPKAMDRLSDTPVPEEVLDVRKVSKGIAQRKIDLEVGCKKEYTSENSSDGIQNMIKRKRKEKNTTSKRKKPKLVEKEEGKCNVKTSPSPTKPTNSSTHDSVSGRSLATVGDCRKERKVWSPSSRLTSPISYFKLEPDATFYVWARPNSCPRGRGSTSSQESKESLKAEDFRVMSSIQELTDRRSCPNLRHSTLMNSALCKAKNVISKAKQNH